MSSGSAAQTASIARRIRSRAAPVRTLPAHPGVEGHPVEVGEFGLPGLLRIDLRREPFDLLQGEPDFGQGDRVHFGNGALVAPDLPLALDQVEPLTEGRKRLETELGNQLEDPVLAGPDPLSAELDDLAVTDRLIDGPATDPVPGLEDDDVNPFGLEGAGGAEAGKAGTDNGDICLSRLHEVRIVGWWAASVAGSGPACRPVGRDDLHAEVGSEQSLGTVVVGSDVTRAEIREGAHAPLMASRPPVVDRRLTDPVGWGDSAHRCWRPRAAVRLSEGRALGTDFLNWDMWVRCARSPRIRGEW